MIRYLRLFAVFMKTELRLMFMFRWPFLLSFLSQGLNYAVTFLLMWIMVTNFGTMNGWTAHEVMFLYAVSLTAYGFAGLFFYFLRHNTIRDVLNGNFDDVLTKPVSPLAYVTFKNLKPGYITHLTVAIIMLVVCISRLDIQITILTVLYLIGIIICGTLIYGGMFLFITAPVFITAKVDSLANFMFFFRESGYYPLSIFPKFLQIIMTVILPYGMINFFPLQPLLQKQDYLMFGANIVYFVPVFTAVFFGLSVVAFNLCCRRYSSTGS